MKNCVKILIAALLLIPFLSNAQQASTLYYMDRVFQSQTVNISQIPENKIQIGGLIVPLIGQLPPAFYFNYGNNSFNYNHIIHHGKGEKKDSLVIDMPLLMKKVHRNTCIRGEFRIDYFNLAVRTKKNSVITVNLSDRLMFGTTLPKSLFDFFLNGNKEYMLEGKPHDISRLSFDLSAFHELGVGYTADIREKFSVGGRIKLLFGMANVSTKVTSLELSTDPELYFITTTADMQIRKSTGIFEYDGDDFSFGGISQMTGDLAALGNIGLGMDLGVSYKINDKIAVSLSATDIGFINWLQNSQIASTKGEYTFEGVELGFKENAEGKLSYGINSERYSMDHIMDTLADLFEMDIREKSYMTWLPSNVFVGATYQLHEKVGFGLLYRGEIYRKSYNQALSLSVNSNLTHWLSLHASWSLINNTMMNLGFGFSMRAAFMTWFVVTDDVIGLIFPQKAKTVNMRMGCNLTFGHKKKVTKTSTRL
ncbi:MAG: hypothetical protein J6T63_07690 [Bacteroidales bacterium]|nr:hypothetical protein [Bacteroidales bacterium]